MKEVIRREKEAGITPDLDIDTYMKVRTNPLFLRETNPFFIYIFFQSFSYIYFFQSTCVDYTNIYINIFMVTYLNKSVHFSPFPNTIHH